MAVVSCSRRPNAENGVGDLAGFDRWLAFNIGQG